MVIWLAETDSFGQSHQSQDGFPFTQSVRFTQSAKHGLPAYSTTAVTYTLALFFGFRVSPIWGMAQPAAAPAAPRPRRPGAPRGTKFVPYSIEDQVRLAYSTPTPHVYRPTDPRHPDIADSAHIAFQTGSTVYSTYIVSRTFPFDLPKMQAAGTHADPWADLLHKALNEEQTHEVLLCKIGAALLVLLLLSWSFFKRPRATGSIVVAWLCWFAWQLNRGHSAWQEVLHHAQTAADRTTAAIRAVAEMLAAWVALFVPALHDLWNTLCPLARDFYISSLWLWNSMSWEERGIVLLCAMGLGGAIYVILMIWKARAWLQESSVACLGFLQQALFHLSFVVLGPLIWWIARRCPPEVPSVIYFVLATLWPVFATSRALLRHHREKEDKARNDEEAQKEAQKARKWWHFRLKISGLKEEFRMSSQLEEEMCFWLSYWSCWPLLGAIQVSMDALTDQSAAGSSGLLIALTLWLQYWRGCFVAPYVFRLLTHLFGFCIEYASGALDAVRQLVFSFLQRLPWHSYFANILQGDTVLLAVLGVVLVVLCLEVASVVSVLVTVVLLFSISMESARCVANEHQQMYADRLAFWVLVTTWLWALQIPAVGRILAIWSPLAFGAAFFGGESAFLAMFFAVLNAINAVLSCLNNSMKRQLEAQKAQDSDVASNQVRMKEPLLGDSTGHEVDDDHVDLENHPESQTAVSRQHSSESKTGSEVRPEPHEAHEPTVPNSEREPHDFEDGAEKPELDSLERGEAHHEVERGQVDSVDAHDVPSQGHLERQSEVQQSLDVDPLAEPQDERGDSRHQAEYPGEQEDSHAMDSKQPEVGPVGNEVYPPKPTDMDQDQEVEKCKEDGENLPVEPSESGEQVEDSRDTQKLEEKPHQECEETREVPSQHEQSAEDQTSETAKLEENLEKLDKDEGHEETTTLDPLASVPQMPTEEKNEEIPSQHLISDGTLTTENTGTLRTDGGSKVDQTGVPDAGAMAEEAATAGSSEPQILEAQNEHDESSKPLDHFEQGGKGADQKKPKPYGKISTSKLPSPLDYTSKHKSFVPGPTYVPPPWAKIGKPFCPEGGRFMLDAHKPKSYFDVAPKLYEANPPPGTYDAKGSVEFKAVGQVVYRYESATSSETKDMVAKAVGTADEVPGPGQYKLPEPRPLAQPPALKGRTLPYSMPHPYAYNCAPDHTRSFLAPVRQSNNGEQIFGNGWKPGAAAAARRQGERNKHSGREDQVQLSELPAGVGDEEKPDDDGIVQWRSGGFSLLKKSRSAGAVRVPEIDSTVLEGVGRFYPPLAQKHQRANSQFLPMSSRRTESVRTREASEENQRLGQSKWKLAKVLEGIETATNAALEPLDVEKLKETAMKGLRDKAINRMKLQGVSKDQQEVILEEMDALLRERANSAKAEASDEIDPNEFSYPNVQGSENELFRVQEEAEESADVEEYHLQDSMEADLDLPGDRSDEPAEPAEQDQSADAHDMLDSQE
eukprot:s367_g10.t2